MAFTGKLVIDSPARQATNRNASEHDRRDNLPSRHEQNVDLSNATTPKFSLSASEKINSALTRLAFQSSIHVDSTGTIHTDKGVFSTREATPLVTIKRLGDNHYCVDAGIPPITPPRTGKGQRPTMVGDGKAILSATIVESGSWLSLGPACTVRIPSGPVDAGTPEGKLANLLVQAEIGDVVRLGREAVRDCPETVSRVHATATVLEKVVREGGQLSLSVLVHRGIPSPEPSFLIGHHGTRQRLDGPITVEGGAVLRLPDPIGDVQIPGERQLHASPPLRARPPEARAGRALKTAFGPKDRDSFTALNAHKYRDERSTQAVSCSELEHSVRQGLRLIADGKYDKALHHFSKQPAFDRAGYEFEVNHVYMLTRLTDDAVAKVLHNVAQSSWFRPHSKLIYPGIAIAHESLNPASEVEEELLKKFHKEIALFHAEETTHALQHYRKFESGLVGTVSKHGALLLHDISRGKRELNVDDAVEGAADANEADVAAFFFEQGIELSHDFVQRRYDSRWRALSFIHGLQKNAEVEVVRDLFQSLPTDGVLVLGANPSRTEHQIGFPILPSQHGSLRHQDQQERSILRAEIANELQDEEVAIRKGVNGEPILTPLGNQSHIFTADENGYFARLRETKAIAMTDPFYVGRGFRFSLADL